ncbi:MAG: hypothetical protein L3J04_05375 [Robiginitomaculum sp.]|nr:hypothetical protein [Robiginitomaculum sp.]
MSEGITLTPAQEKARKLRSLAIAFGLFGFVAVVFTVTVYRKMQELGIDAVS